MSNCLNQELDELDRVASAIAIISGVCSISPRECARRSCFRPRHAAWTARVQ